jgi:hypothetical protein
MNSNKKIKSISILLGAMLCLATGAPALAQDGSGFLKDYSQLEVKKDSKGVERKIWISDKLNGQNYQKIIIDSIDFFPKPQPSDQVSMGALNDIRGYIDSGARKAFGASIPLVSTAGPGVVRMRWAITAASVDKSLKAYQLIPVALIFTAAKRGTGNASYDVKLMIETELVDSVSGEVLARSVREAKGVEVKGDAPLTLKVAQPQIDTWLAAVQDIVAARLGKPAK